MYTRGVVAGVIGALIAVGLSGCGGTATAAGPTTEVDVRAVAENEIRALSDLGYPTDLTTWDFVSTFTNEAGGMARAQADATGRTEVTLSTDADAYLTLSADVEDAVRSTVRHEFGHALTYWLFPNGAETPLSKLCTESTPATVETGSPAGECAAEAIAMGLAEERGTPHTPSYGMRLSTDAVDALRPVLAGATSWEVPEP